MSKEHIVDPQPVLIDDPWSDSCIPEPLEVRLTPVGVRYLAIDSERKYRTGDGNSWYTRQEYKDWSRHLGCEVDPLIWYTRMSHYPIPPDVRAVIPEDKLKVLDEAGAGKKDNTFHIGGDSGPIIWPTTRIP